MNLDISNAHIETNTIIESDTERYKHPMAIVRLLGYKIESPSELIGFTIPRERIYDRYFTDEIRDYLPILRQSYSTHSLTCLHENAEEKQQQPNLNLLRQILKCNGLYLKPITRSGGYNKTTGKKIVFREYTIVYAK
jgi:hypothetical protein